MGSISDDSELSLVIAMIKRENGDIFNSVQVLRKEDPSPNLTLTNESSADETLNVSFEKEKTFSVESPQPAPIQKRRCLMCPRIFLSTRALRLHKMTHRRMPFECGICGKKFLDKRVLSDHQSEEHSSVKALFDCKYCDAHFIHENHLRQHMLNHDVLKNSRTPNLKLNCVFCKQEFSKREDQRRHVRTEHGKHSLRCDICNFTFKRLYNLEMHLKLHTGESDYKCLVCNMQFTFRSNFTNHWKFHQGVQDQVKYDDNNPNHIISSV